MVAVLVGVAHWTEMKHPGSKINFTATSTNFLDLPPALFATLWAYDGWNMLNYASEELANPDDVIRIVRLAIPFVTFLFVFVNASYLLVLDPEIVANSHTIGVDLAVDTFGVMGERLMPLFVAISAFGAAVGNMFGGARLAYASARKGTLPEFLSTVHDANSLPVHAVLFQTILGCMFILIGDFEMLVGMYSCAAWIFYFATITGMMRTRVTEPNLIRPYRASMISASIFATAAFTLMLAEFIAAPINTFTAFGFILGGVPFYQLQSLPAFRRCCCLRKHPTVDHVVERGDEEKLERENGSYSTFS